MPQNSNELNISSQTAKEMLERMRRDYGTDERFEEACEQDPTILARYELLLKCAATEEPAQNYLDWPEASEDVWYPDPAAPTHTPIQKQTAVQSDNKHYNANPVWNYRTNLWKLFILGKLIKTEPTPELSWDLDHTRQQVEEYGNKEFKKKHLSAEELLQKEQSKVLMGFGINVVKALIRQETDFYRGKYEMEDCYREINETQNINHAENLRKSMRIVKKTYQEIKAKHSR